MKKLFLGTASVLALGIAGAALDYSADAGNALTNEGVSAASQTSHTLLVAANLSKDDIRQAQLELRNMGLYAGSLDGIVGPETKRALAQFQKKSGLRQTATLDPKTTDALVGNPGIGQGSSMPANTGGVKPMGN
jgi:peptidoglycan hydrolase-like protein with peptidoglycan-binding domain